MTKNAIVHIISYGCEENENNPLYWANKELMSREGVVGILAKKDKEGNLWETDVIIAPIDGIDIEIREHGGDVCEPSGEEHYITYSEKLGVFFMTRHAWANGCDGSSDNCYYYVSKGGKKWEDFDKWLRTGDNWEKHDAWKKGKKDSDSSEMHEYADWNEESNRAAHLE